MLGLHLAAIRAFGPAAYDEQQAEAWAYTGSGPTYPIEGPDHARKGFGTTLLERLESVARERDCECPALTASRNAVGFYERAGNDRIERVDDEPTGPHDVTVDCVRTAKPLR